MRLVSPRLSFFVPCAPMREFFYNVMKDPYWYDV